VKIKVVLDTNVLVSSLLSSGPPAVIVDLVADGKLTPFFNDFIVSEYLNVLLRPKFNFFPFQVSRLLDDIMRTGIAVDVTDLKPDEPGVIAMPDKDDRVFYHIAGLSYNRQYQAFPGRIIYPFSG